jgi:hypothetical protein
VSGPRLTDKIVKTILDWRKTYLSANLSAKEVMMNVSPVPIPNNLFQPIANHWLPANGGRVIVSECEGVDYLCLDGECRLAHQLPKKKKAEQYDLLFDLLNLV